MNSATVLVEKDNGYQATYFYEFFQRRPTPETIDKQSGSPNLAYRVEKQFNHFLFYKDNFSYDDAGGQHRNSELIEIGERDIGKDYAKERCLELLLGDKDILYKKIFVRPPGASNMWEVTRVHAGWVE